MAHTKASTNDHTRLTGLVVVQLGAQSLGMLDEHRIIRHTIEYLTGSEALHGKRIIEVIQSEFDSYDRNLMRRTCDAMVNSSSWSQYIDDERLALMRTQLAEREESDKDALSPVVSA